MNFASNLPVYILFAFLLYKICTDNEAGKFYALALGTLLFPAAGTIIVSPTIVPNHAFIYSYLGIEFIQSIGKRGSGYKRILIFPLLLIIISTTATILYTEGFSGKTFYVAIRDFFETYGYLIAAFVAGTKVSGTDPYTKFYKPVLILCFFAVIEVLFEYNIPYTIICSAYPNYDMGFTSLQDGSVFVDSWRIRATVTTVHPTALGTLLCCLFAFYLPLWKKHIIEQNKLFFLLSAILIATFFCGSRTAMLCEALSIAVFVFSRANIYIKILLAGLVIFSFGTIISMMINQFENSRGSNLDLRREQLLFSVLAIQRSPIYGNGVQYTSKYIFESDDRDSKGVARGAGNIYLGGLESIIFRKIIDYGFFGLGCFLVYLAFFQFYFLINRKKSIYASSGILITLSFTVFLILSGTLANSAVYGYTFLGYCLARTRIAKTSNYEKDKDDSVEGISYEEQD